MKRSYIITGAALCLLVGMLIGFLFFPTVKVPAFAGETGSSSPEAVDLVIIDALPAAHLSLWNELEDLMLPLLSR